MTAAHHTSGLSRLVLVHHLIVRSQRQQGSRTLSLPLPNTVYDLSREEYMKWMDSIENEKEGVQLALDAITKNKLSQAQLQDIPEYKLILDIVASDDEDQEE